MIYHWQTRWRTKLHCTCTPNTMKSFKFVNPNFRWFLIKYIFVYSLIWISKNKKITTISRQTFRSAVPQNRKETFYLFGSTKSGSSGMNTWLTVDCLMSSTKYFMHIQMSINSIIFKNYFKMNISSAGVWKHLCNLNPHTACRPDNSKIIKRTSCSNFNINIFQNH